ncbi:MAG: sigma-70 family RNA polymerase sigma factor [Lentisphaeraceae bacterium]|nr:sigma-70 family RNA polymerase sigma factor [Lentisphaeraceae bacterium]
MSNEDYQTRQTLLAKIKENPDDHSWEDFSYYYSQYIYNIVRRMKLGHHDAEDLVQMILLKLWNKMPEFEYNPGKGAFRGWLCRVTQNETKNYLRKKNKFIDRENESNNKPLNEEDYAVSLPEIETISKTEWQVYVTNLAWKNIKNEFNENVQKAFVELYSDKSSREVADSLGLELNTVNVYKQRVRKRMLQEIKRLRRELDC